MTSQSVDYVGLGATCTRAATVMLNSNQVTFAYHGKRYAKIFGLVENMEEKKWMGVRSAETDERKIHSGLSVVEPPYTLLITNKVAHQVIGAAFPPVQIRTH